MDFRKQVLQYKEDIIRDLVALLQIPSVLLEQPQSKSAPFGQGIKDSLDFMLDLGTNLGFSCENVEDIAGHIELKGKDAKETLAILCHLDVVPAGQGWTTAPFSADIRNGRIYARGAVDDKGPTIAALYAMKIIKDLGLAPSRHIKMILGTDEETKWRGIKRYLEKFPMPELGFAPDANFPLIYGEKGIASFDFISENKEFDLISFTSGERYNVVPDHAEAIVKVKLEEEFAAFLKIREVQGEIVQTGENYKYILEGIGAHAMQPHKGKNAAVFLAEFLNSHIQSPALSMLSDILSDSSFQKLGMDFSDEEMGALTMNVGVVTITKEETKIGINIRYPKGWDIQSFQRDIGKLANEYQLKTICLSNDPVHFVDKNDSFIETLHKAYKKYTNDTTTKLMTIGGGTYARALKKAVAFGPMLPGSEDVVHQADEYIEIDTLLTATAIYAQAIYDLVREI